MSNWSLADQEKVESDSLSQPRNLRGSWEADERSSSSHYVSFECVYSVCLGVCFVGIRTTYIQIHITLLIKKGKEAV